MSYINLFWSLVAISFLIFFHELGHFLFFRWFGVHVKVFAVGALGAIYRYKDKYGTQWLFGWCLLGGYVEPASVKDKEEALGAGSEGLESLAANSNVGMLSGLNIEDLPPLKMAAVAFAGPLFNFILAFVILLFLNVGVGAPVMKYEIANVVVDSVADKHGFLPNDRIIEITSRDGDKIKKGVNNIPLSDGCVVTIDRVNEIVTKKIKLKEGERFNGLGFRYSFERHGVFESILLAFKKVINLIVQCFVGLFLLFKALFLNLLGYKDQNFNNLTGTVGIVKLLQDALTDSIYSFLYWVAVISVNLGAANLLPIPLVDGGHIVISFVHWIFGKKIDDAWLMQVLNYCALGGLISFLIITVFLDFKKLGCFSYFHNYSGY